MLRNRLDSQRLPGPVVVTGTGAGIGRATALAFARRGRAVFGCDVDLAAAEATADACREVGVAAEAHGVDVSDAAAVSAWAADLVARHGTPAVVVNNAGVGMTGSFLATELADWQWIVGINLMGVVHGCRAFGPALIEAGRGHVVNVSSALGYLTTPDEAAYCATKHAVLALSRSLRADWRRHGVGVSAVCPGIIDTSILTTTRYRGGSDRRDVRQRLQRMFSGRSYAPDRVAAGILEAVARDRAVLPISPEAWLAYGLTRWLPVGAQDLLGRLLFPARG